MFFGSVVGSVYHNPHRNRPLFPITRQAFVVVGLHILLRSIQLADHCPCFLGYFHRPPTYNSCLLCIGPCLLVFCSCCFVFCGHVPRVCFRVHWTMVVPCGDRQRFEVHRRYSAPDPGDADRSFWVHARGGEVSNCRSVLC